MHLKVACTQNTALQKWFFHHIPINLRMLLSTLFCGNETGEYFQILRILYSTHGNRSNPRYQSPNLTGLLSSEDALHPTVSAFLFLTIKQ